MDELFELSNGFSFVLGEYREIRNEILIDTYGSKSKGFMLGAVSLIYQQLKSLGLKLNTYLENFNSFNNNAEFTSVTFGVNLSEVENLPGIIYSIGKILQPYGIKCIAIEKDGFKLVDLRTKEFEEGEISDSYREIKIKSLSTLNKNFTLQYIDTCLKNLEAVPSMINIDANDIRRIMVNSDIVYFYEGFYTGKEITPNQLGIGPADKGIIYMTANKEYGIDSIKVLVEQFKKVNGRDISIIFGMGVNDKLTIPEVFYIATRSK